MLLRTVVVPEIVLTTVPVLILEHQAVDHLLRLSGVAFAVVGVITGVRSWRAIPRLGPRPDEGSRT